MKDFRYSWWRRNTAIVPDPILIVYSNDAGMRVVMTKPNTDNLQEAVLPVAHVVIESIARALDIPVEGLLNMLRQHEPLTEFTDLLNPPTE